MDAQRLVFPPLPAFVVAAVIYALLAGALPQVPASPCSLHDLIAAWSEPCTIFALWRSCPPALHDRTVVRRPLCIDSDVSMLLPSQAAVLPVFAGVLLGYLAYDCMHYAIHHGALPRGGLLALIRSAHLEHHFRRPDANFGISSPLVDLLLRTGVPAKQL